MTSEATTSAREGGGRANQRERTRQALLASARALLAQGQPVTIAKAAANALISEPTAYRYYSDARTLTREALSVEWWSGFDDVVAEIKTIPEMVVRARRAAEAMARQVLAHEAEIRALIAMAYEPGNPEGAEKHGTSRPDFRGVLINAIMEAKPADMKKASTRRLHNALSVVIAAEAVFSLKDATGADDDEILSTLGWSASRIASEA